MSLVPKLPVRLAGQPWPACSLALLHGSEDEIGDDLTSWKAGHDAGCLEPAEFAVDTQSGATSLKVHLCLSSNTPAEYPKMSLCLLLLSCYTEYLFSLKCTKIREQPHSSSPALTIGTTFTARADAFRVMSKVIKCSLLLVKLGPVQDTRNTMFEKGLKVHFEQLEVCLGKLPLSLPESGPFRNNRFQNVPMVTQTVGHSFWVLWQLLQS